MRRLGVWISVLMLVAFAAGCRAKGPEVPAFPAGSTRLKVAASFYPLYEFARAVGGEKVDLVVLVPNGVEPHEWEPTPAHIKTLNEAGLLLYNGGALEPWLPKVLKSVDNKSLVATETGSGFDRLPDDPHIWLDPRGVVHQVTAIRDSLIKADVANRAVYEGNSAAYIAKLTALDQEYQAGLSVCKRRDFYTSHEAFGYLARRYGLQQRAIAGLSPETEPKPQDLARIVAEARKNDVKYIFFETLVSDKLAKVVATEVGAQTLVLNPFEGLTPDEVKAGKEYLSVMRENLANLSLALECGK